MMIKRSPKEKDPLHCGTHEMDDIKGTNSTLPFTHSVSVTEQRKTKHEKEASSPKLPYPLSIVLTLEERVFFFFFSNPFSVRSRILDQEKEKKKIKKEKEK